MQDGHPYDTVPDSRDRRDFEYRTDKGTFYVRFSDDVEPDNRKTEVDVYCPDGERRHADVTPYRPKQDAIRAFIDLGFPDRDEAGICGPFDIVDLEVLWVERHGELPESMRRDFLDFAKRPIHHAIVHIGSHVASLNIGDTRIDCCHPTKQAIRRMLERQRPEMLGWGKNRAIQLVAFDGAVS